MYQVVIYINGIAYHSEAEHETTEEADIEVAGAVAALSATSFSVEVVS